jgi:GT2 family glycosyltransferase
MTSPFTTGGIRGSKKNLEGTFHPRGFNMGISREVWNKTGGFSYPNFGEDMELSIRIHAMGFNIGLIPGAIVYHKRRGSFKQFYKQIHSFGRTRINLYKIGSFFSGVFYVIFSIYLPDNSVSASYSGFQQFLSGFVHIINIFSLLGSEQIFICCIFEHICSTNPAYRLRDGFYAGFY